MYWKREGRSGILRNNKRYRVLEEGGDISGILRNNKRYRVLEEGGDKWYIKK